MDVRRTLFVAGFVGASISYVFNVLAFTGTFDVFRWAVFAVLYLWSPTDSTGSSPGRPVPTERP
ncbi:MULTISPECIES: hypothetical protein [Halorubrum]|uniref:hypothetical protein n=1 Tax=Halorubrum TaxID=56688 RepID=UPI001EFA05D4|nr:MULTISPECIES: hypothetical protein [Halorubrum]